MAGRPEEEKERLTCDSCGKRYRREVMGEHCLILHPRPGPAAKAAADEARATRDVRRKKERFRWRAIRCDECRRSVLPRRMLFHSLVSHQRSSLSKAGLAYVECRRRNEHRGPEPTVVCDDCGERMERRSFVAHLNRIRHHGLAKPPLWTPRQSSAAAKAPEGLHCDECGKPCALPRILSDHWLNMHWLHIPSAPLPWRGTCEDCGWSAARNTAKLARHCELRPGIAGCAALRRPLKSLPLQPRPKKAPEPCHCDDCPKICALQSNLTKHWRNAHSGVGTGARERFYCDDCGQSCGLQSNLAQHWHFRHSSLTPTHL